MPPPPPFPATLQQTAVKKSRASALRSDLARNPTRPLAPAQSSSSAFRHAHQEQPSPRQPPTFVRACALLTRRWARTHYTTGPPLGACALLYRSAAGRARLTKRMRTTEPPLDACALLTGRWALAQSRPATGRVCTTLQALRSARAQYCPAAARTRTTGPPLGACALPGSFPAQVVRRSRSSLASSLRLPPLHPSP